ncbi:MAG: hypothetical protein QNK37_20635 [Acidobacteriota bacterium]|nr:hypothetical protein [Acidobacteriota bacterium]
MTTKTKNNNTTITLSIPHNTKLFLDQLAMDGYNRSNLMLKMIHILHMLYFTYPQIPLPRGIERLQDMVAEGVLLKEFQDGHMKPKPESVVTPPETKGGLPFDKKKE